MRVDKWLWAARFFKTRSLAQQAIAAGRVKLDGDRIKPAHDVKIGNALAIRAGDYEFVVRSVDDSAERVVMDAEVVHAGRHRDFFGFNRAKHAVVEAAILATRFHLLPLDEVAAEFARLRVVVGKTGGPAEHEAMDFLESRLRDARAAGGRP